MVISQMDILSGFGGFASVGELGRRGKSFGNLKKAQDRQHKDERVRETRQTVQSPIGGQGNPRLKFEALLTPTCSFSQSPI